MGILGGGMIRIGMLGRWMLGGGGWLRGGMLGAGMWTG